MGTEPRTDTGSSPEEPSGRTTGNKYFKEYMRLVHVSLRSWWWGEPLAATLGGLGGAWIGHDDDLPMGFTTHSPDLFAGDFLLNLASEDEAHWERSIRELQRVVDTTREMQQHFTRHADAKGATEGPVIVASLGGFTTDAFVAPAERERMYARVAEGLARVDDSGVRLCAQTLPPYPWYMGGQLYCNLFVDPRDTAENFGGNCVGGIDAMYVRRWVISDNVFAGIRGRTGAGRGCVFLWQES